MIASPLSSPPPLPLAPIVQLLPLAVPTAAPVVFALPPISETLPEMLPVSLPEISREDEEAELPDLICEGAPPLPAIITLLLSGAPLIGIEPQTIPSLRTQRGNPEADAAQPGLLGCARSDDSLIRHPALILSATATPPTSASVPLESAPKPLPSANAALELFAALATETQELDTLSNDIAALSSPSRRIAFRMEGAQLGMLDVQLTSSDAGVSIGFRTETEHSRAAVAQAQPRLVEDLRATGLRVSDTHVSTDAGSSQRDRPAEPKPPPMVEHASTPSDPANPTAPKPSGGRFA